MGGILLLVVGIAFAAGAAGLRWKGAKGWDVQLFPGGSSGISYVLDSAVEPAVEPDDPAAGKPQYHQEAGNVRRARRLTA